MPSPNPLEPQEDRKFGCLSVVGWVIVAATLTVALTLLLFWRMGTEVTQQARNIALLPFAGRAS